jgi:hypothetical protein
MRTCRRADMLDNARLWPLRGEDDEMTRSICVTAACLAIIHAAASQRRRCWLGAFLLK